jgi:hypothetical protein
MTGRKLGKCESTEEKKKSERICEMVGRLPRGGSISRCRIARGRRWKMMEEGGAAAKVKTGVT